MCSIACHKEGIDCGNLSFLANRTEKRMVQHRKKHRRANIAELSVHWYNKEGESESGEDLDENSLAELELERLVKSGGRSLPLWTKEKDLVSMTWAGENWLSKVQSDMRLRSCQLNT